MPTSNDKRRLPASLLSRKNRILAGITALALGSAGALMATAPQHDPAAVEEKVWPVTGVTAMPGPMAPELQLFGRVETPDHATLSSALEAEVTALRVREGEQVQAGQLLLSLDPAEATLMVREREAGLAASEAQLATLTRDAATHREVLGHMRELYTLTRSKAERLQTLNKRNLIATEQLEDTLQEVTRQGIELARQQALVDNRDATLAGARAAVERARALLEQSRLDLSRSEVRAPFDGRVSSLAVATGNRVQPGQALISLYDTAGLQLRVPLPADAVVTLKRALSRGDRIEATLAGHAGLASLQALAGEVGPGKAGLDAIFTLAGSDIELGRAVDVKIALPATPGAVALPPQSLYGSRRVYAIEEGRLRGIEVRRLGRRTGSDGRLELLVGSPELEPGMTLLATDLPKASSGLRVRLVNDQLAAGKQPADAPVPQV